jgi:hypothetical protein
MYRHRITLAGLVLRAQNTILTTTTEEPMHYTQNDERITARLEQARRDREEREKRDRILARELGIEIGRRRQLLETNHKAAREFTIGVFVGLALAIICVALSILTDKADARPKPITTIIGTGAHKQRIVYELHRSDLPPAWRTWLEICKREQPAKGWGWAAVAWTNTTNSSYPGGCGLTRTNYDEIKHAAWPATMNLLTPRDQLWACFFLYWKYARIGEAMRGYAGGQRYGATVWDVHSQFGFHGFQEDGETR